MFPSLQKYVHIKRYIKQSWTVNRACPSYGHSQIQGRELSFWQRHIFNISCTLRDMNMNESIEKWLLNPFNFSMTTGSDSIIDYDYYCLYLMTIHAFCGVISQQS